MWAKFASIILRNRIAVLILVALVTVFMGYQAVSVKMSYELTQMLPQTDSVSIAFENFKKEFGQDRSVLIIGVEDERLFELDNFNAWHKLTKSLTDIPIQVNEDTLKGVEEAISIANCYNLVKLDSLKQFKIVPIVSRTPQSQKEVDSIRDVLYSLPFYKGFLYNDSSVATFIAITLNKKVFDTPHRKELLDKILEKVDAFKESSSIEVHLSGLPYIRYYNTEKVAKEVQLFCLLAIVVTALILLAFFRSFRAVFLSLIVVGVGVVWAIGIMGIFGYKITILSGMIPPLMIVIGIPNCVFLLNKYYQEYSSHRNQIKALSRIIQKTGTAILMTNTTTALGFGTFVITKSQSLVEFGYVASLSVMAVFLISITFIPLVFSFLAPPKSRHTSHLEMGWMKSLVEQLITIVSNYRKWVYVGTILIFGFSIYGITLIKTTGNISDDLPKDGPIRSDLRFFEENFGGVLPFEVLIDTKQKGKATKLSTLRKMDKLQEILEKYPELSKPISIVDGLKFSKQAFYNGRESKYKLVTNQEKSFIGKYLTNTNGDENELFKSFVDSTKRVVRISAQMADIGTSEMERLHEDLKPKIDSIFNPEQYKVSLTGTSVTYLRGNSYLVKNLLSSLILAIILIALIMAILFKTIRMVMVSLIPNILPLIFTAGIMGYFGIPIKPSTILVFSIAFGISVDDTIHYLAKYRQELKAYKGTPNIRDSVIRSLRESGISMIYTSVILFFGFGVFTASQFGGTVALGLLVAVTLLFAMLANLILLPSLLLSLERSLTTKEFEEEPIIPIEPDEIEVIDDEEE